MATTTTTKLDTKTTGKGKLGLLVLGVGLISLLNLATTFTFGMAKSSSSSQTMIQLANGETVTAKKVSNTKRTPEVIKNFSEKIITGIYTNDGYLPRTSIEEANNPQKDEGIDIEGTNKKVPTGAWYMSMGLEPQLRKEVLQELAKATPQSTFKQERSLVFVPNYIGEPIADPEKPGYWTVNLVSTLIAFEGKDRLGDVIPNNKKLYIRAVKAPKYEEFSNPVAQIVADVRQSGLEIYHIGDLSREELEKSAIK